MRFVGKIIPSRSGTVNCIRTSYYLILFLSDRPEEALPYEVPPPAASFYMHLFKCDLDRLGIGNGIIRFGVVDVERERAGAVGVAERFARGG